MRVQNKRILVLVGMAVLVIIFAFKPTEPETIMTGTRVETEVYINDSGKEGPVLLVIAGIHGNEEAGVMAAEEIIGLKPKRGKLIVIPAANKPAYENDVRTMYDMYDLNRHFPGNESGNITEQLAFKIMDIIREHRPDIILDLHEYDEGYLEEDLDGKNALIFSDESALDVLLNMEASIDYVLLSHPVEGSINKVCSEMYNIPVITVETYSGLSLEERMDAHRLIIQRVSKWYH